MSRVLRDRSLVRCPTKRHFLTGIVSAGAAAAMARTTAAQSEAPSLTLYILVWHSLGGKIPWRDPSPRKVIKTACHVIWSYARRVQEDLRALSQESVIGHAALYAIMRMPNQAPRELVFSDTGGNVGFYHLGQWQHSYPFPILASFRVLETLAGHLGDGHWESLEEFRARVSERSDPRVQKVTLRGEEATLTHSLLQTIRNMSDKHNEKEFGSGPKHFGLNTSAVRLVDNFDRVPPLPMQKYNIGGQQHEIHGGCANAVASVLRAARLGHLAPARIEVNLSFAAFKGKTVPVLIGDEVFDDRANVQDADLRKALLKIPEAWGSGNELVFSDPNHWYEALPPNEQNLADLKRDMTLR